MPTAISTAIIMYETGQPSGSRDQDQRVGDEQRGAVAELIRRRQQPSSSESLAASMRQASTTMSWVDEEKATSSASAPTAVRPCAGPRIDRPSSPMRDEHLRQQHPAAPASEAAEERRVDPIDDRRPEELERVGEADPREEADRLERRALVAQPVAERVAGQQERQAGREAQREHDRDFWLSERRDDVAPACCPLPSFQPCLFGGLDHSSCDRRTLPREKSKMTHETATTVSMSAGVKATPPRSPR